MLTTAIDPERLRAAMTRKGLSATQLADAIGVTKATIYSYMQGRRGKRPSFHTIMALAKALDLDDPGEILTSSLFSCVTNDANACQDERQEDGYGLASH